MALKATPLNGAIQDTQWHWNQMSSTLKENNSPRPWMHIYSKSRCFGWLTWLAICEFICGFELLEFKSLNMCEFLLENCWTNTITTGVWLSFFFLLKCISILHVGTFNQEGNQNMPPQTSLHYLTVPSVTVHEKDFVTLRSKMCSVLSFYPVDSFRHVQTITNQTSTLHPCQSCLWCLLCSQQTVHLIIPCHY